MNVTKDKVVSVSYELKVEGEVVDRAEVENPMQFIYGNGALIPSFENNIKDMKAGDNFDFSIPADQAYGPVVKEYVLNLPKNIFERDGKIDEGLLQVGARLPMVDQEGNQMNGLVVEVKEDHVVMDFNHPLAGKDLHFAGKVEAIRDASAEELVGGHAHNPEHNHEEGCDSCKECDEK
ncbi:MAG: peptidylprolyl isomerase [Bacteroidales bacterium]|nr:peptidylprolyl isomerase [Bacteroidales bacterium]MDY0347931.1 peptidylprolyl isomerase [Tenuifilaceae bacterium]